MKNDEHAVEAPEALSGPEAFATTPEHHTSIQIHGAARRVAADRSEGLHLLENQTEHLKERHRPRASQNARH